MFVFQFDSSGALKYSEHIDDKSSTAQLKRQAVQQRKTATIQPENQQLSSSTSHIHIQPQTSKDISGNTSNLNSLNDRFMEKLEDSKAELVYLMRHSSIEDGMENEVVDYIKPYYEENKYMTILYFYKLYSEFQDDSVVFSNILNLFFFLDVKHYDMPYFTSIVSNGLNSPFSMVQELAIKVSEKWRTKDCLVALKQAQFRSAWIDSYARQVISELEEELQ